MQTEIESWIEDSSHSVWTIAQACAPAPASASSGIPPSDRFASTSRRSSRRKNTTAPRPSASAPIQGSNAMKLRNLALAGALMIGLTNMVGLAVAQTKVFVVNEDTVRRESKVGKEMSAMLSSTANQGADQLGLKALQEQIKT